jgi:Na+-transporting NADH:ubiquinone oxidoreductase subunit NqrC
VLLGFATAASLVAAPVAGASSAPKPSEGICSKINTASVSAIVGYKLPAPSVDTLTLPATKKNDEISSVVTSCTYGSQTSLAALPKDVIIDYSVTSRALTSAEVKKGLAQAQQLKMTFLPYSGLGVKAYYYSFTESGITIQGLTGFEGTKEYGAATYSKLTSKSQLASLVRLAEKL